MSPLETAPTYPPIVARVLSEYGVDPVEIHAPEAGYRNRSFAVETATAVVNLILYKAEPGILAKIQAANRTSNYLAGHGFPARQTADPRIIRLHSPRGDRYGSLYHYLPGHTIPWEAYTMEHLKLLGSTMSDMHASLQGIVVAAPSVAQLHLELLARVKRYVADPKATKALAVKLGLVVDSRAFRNLGSVLLATERLAMQQLLHMDFVRSNILFQENTSGIIEISGILDFEKVAYGHPSYDIARTLAFLLVDCKFKSERDIRKYFLWSGYHKRGRQKYRSVTLHDRGYRIDLVNALTNMFLLHDFYKFLRHNPYESLPTNEHFVRTVNILKKRGFITDNASVDVNIEYSKAEAE